MRKIREVLRLRYERGLSFREIGRACSMGHTAVFDTIARAKRAGLGWPVEFDDALIEEMLYPSEGNAGGSVRATPDWAAVHRELKRKGVTLALLWQEYKAGHPQGYQYTQFCTLFRRWLSQCDAVMRQRHKAGEKLFVDYAGQTVEVGDREAQLFVAVLGASNFTYIEATWTQGLFDWIGSHVRAFEFFQGVPEIVVPDNLKSGVTSPCRYDPELNPTYRDLADHYCVSIVPARVRRPRDKAKVENGVLQAERWIAAPLRNRRFFSLGELNDAIREKLFEFNHRPFQKLPGSRATAFEETDLPALRPLPRARYEYAEWKRATVGADYHLEVEGHYYSVPYRLIRQKVDVRITAKMVECYQRGVRVAGHVRAEGVRGDFTTLKEHMPPSHRRYLAWSPEKILAEADRIGLEVGAFVRALREGKPHGDSRSSLGVLRLGREYGEERLCGACRRALAMQTLSYRSLCSILKTGLDRAPVQGDVKESPPLLHANLRGPGYFN